jgi:uncharacterized membrane protein
MNKPFRNTRANFFTGVMVLIPVLVIFWLLTILWGWLQGILGILPAELKLENMAFPLQVLVSLGLLIGVVFGVSFLGWFSKRYAGQKALDLFQHMIQRVPVFGAIYTSLDQLVRSLMSGNSKQFRRVVFFEYPRKGAWALGFVTGPSRSKVLPEGYINIFIPTVPNPTSGFHMLVPESEVKDSGLTVEEAFKTILSLGIAWPTPPNPNTSN